MIQREDDRHAGDRQQENAGVTTKNRVSPAFEVALLYQQERLPRFMSGTNGPACVTLAIYERLSK